MPDFRFAERLDYIKAPLPSSAADDARVREIVAGVRRDVEARGDAALRDYTRQFDCVDVDELQGIYGAGPARWALEVAERACADEPEITAALLSGLPNGASLEHLATRLKTPTSLARKIAAKAADLSKSATVIDKAKALLPKEVAENAAIYPPEDKLMKADFILDVGDATKLYQDGLTKVKTAQ